MPVYGWMTSGTAIGGSWHGGGAFPSRRRNNRGMPRVSAKIELPGRVYEAERCWYEVPRWPEWVDQLARVVEVRGEWPRAGSEVVWESHPAGRGTVREHVVQ